MNLEILNICSSCYGIVKEIGNYDESWSVCEECREVEGDNFEVLLDDYEELLCNEITKEQTQINLKLITDETTD
jgi:hypothetical protein